MYSLTIALRDNPAVWTLLYNKKETAEAAFKTVTVGQFFEISDDFGQAVFLPHGVSAALLENMDESSLAHIERALHHARTQAKGQTRANADPAIRSAAMSQGPAVLSSMNGQRGF